VAKPSLVAKVTLLQPKRKSTWFDAISPSAQKELLDLRDAYRKRQLIDATGCQPSVASLWRLSLGELKIKVCISSFKDWMTNGKA